MDAIKKLYERWTRADEDLSLSDNLQLKAQCKNAMACIEEVAGCQKLVALDVSDYERFLSQGGMPKSVIIEDRKSVV